MPDRKKKPDPEARRRRWPTPDLSKPGPDGFYGSGADDLDYYLWLLRRVRRTPGERE